jgi:hypothetical protein
VDSVSDAGRAKRRTFLSAIGIVAAVMVLAPPMVQAASQKVNVVKSVAIGLKPNTTVSAKELKDTTVPAHADHGDLGESSLKAVNVQSLPSGEGLWGVGTCEHPNDANRQVSVPAAEVTDPFEHVVSHIIVGSPDAATVTIAAPDLPSGTTPVLIYRTTAEQPSQSIDISGGLRVSPSDLLFDCPQGGDLAVPNPATYAVLGH